MMNEKWLKELCKHDVYGSLSIVQYLDEMS